MQEKNHVYNKILLWLASSLSCISNLETYIVASKKQKKKEKQEKGTGSASSIF